MDIAEGKYISFIDSDDEILPGMYENLISLMQKNDLDIISCLANIMKRGKVKNAKCTDEKLNIYNYDEGVERCIDKDEASVWSKIYNRNLFDDVRFPEGRVFEDTAIIFKLYDRAKKVGWLNKAYYNYYFNPESISKNAFNPKARYDMVLARKEVFEFATERRLRCVHKTKSWYVKSLLYCLTAIYASNNDEQRRKYFPLVSEQILKYRDIISYKYLNPKYKLFLYCFGKFDFIHKFGAELSSLHKLIKRL